MAHRYYTQDIGGGEARITGPDAVHLARVLRAKPGDELILCDGNNTDYTARIQSVDAECILLATGEGHPSKAEPRLWAELYVGYAKGDKLEQVIQKCVELGASRIIPFFSRNCVVKPKKEEEKNKRYNRIAIEAAKQCGRGILPKVEMPLEYTQMLAEATATGRALFLYECGGAPLREMCKGTECLAIITGPEGGFTPEEAKQAQDAGCATIGLGPRILRCETAPVAALATVMALNGDLE